MSDHDELPANHPERLIADAFLTFYKQAAEDEIPMVERTAEVIASTEVSMLAVHYGVDLDALADKIAHAYGMAGATVRFIPADGVEVLVP